MEEAIFDNVAEEEDDDETDDEVASQVAVTFGLLNTGIKREARNSEENQNSSHTITEPPNPEDSNDIPDI